MVYWYFYKLINQIDNMNDFLDSIIYVGLTSNNERLEKHQIDCQALLDSKKIGLNPVSHQIIHRIVDNHIDDIKTHFYTVETFPIHEFASNIESILIRLMFKSKRSENVAIEDITLFDDQPYNTILDYGISIFLNFFSNRANRQQETVNLSELTNEEKIFLKTHQFQRILPAECKVCGSKERLGNHYNLITCQKCANFFCSNGKKSKIKKIIKLQIIFN